MQATLRTPAQQGCRQRRVVTRAANAPPTTRTYFIASNNFRVKPEHYADFEEVWRTRESHLKEMPGFVRFAMLKNETEPGKYVSQTTWTDEQSFRAWTQSQQFQKSHGSSDDNKRPSVGSMLEGHPQFIGFTTVTTTE